MGASGIYIIMSLYIKEKYSKFKKKVDFLYVESTLLLLLVLILAVSLKHAVFKNKKRKDNEL